VTNACIVARGTPYHQSSVVWRSGQRVACKRRRASLIAALDVTTRNGVTASVTRGNGAEVGCAATSLAIATAVPAKALPAIPMRISRRDPSAGALLALAPEVLFMRIFLCQGSSSAAAAGAVPSGR
jgi:hypothetical protein